jgi:hypothetical protein
MHCEMPASWWLLGWGLLQCSRSVCHRALADSFSDAVCAFARLSSPPPNATVQTVGLRLASRVVTALFSTPTDGFRVSALVWLLGNAFGKAFCGHASDLSRDRASPGVSFVAYHVLVEATSLQPAALRTTQWQLPVQAIEPHVHPLGCVPFPHAQTRPLEWKEICLRVHLHAPFRLRLLLA